MTGATTLSRKNPGRPPDRHVPAGRIAALFATLAVLLFFAPRATAIVLPAAAIALCIIDGRRSGLPHRWIAAVSPALPILTIALASTLWALNPETTASRALRLVLEVGSAGLLFILLPGRTEPVPARVFAALAWALGGAAALAVADVQSGGVLSGWARAEGTVIALAYSRSSAILAITALPLAFALWRLGRRRLAALPPAAALAIYAIGSDTAMLALPLGLVAALGVLAVPTLRWLVLGTQILVVVALPFALPISVDARLCDLLNQKSSALHRIAIWNFSHSQWLERPALGWGLESSRDLGMKRRIPYMGACQAPETAATPPATDEALPLHPHNFVIQVWLELGAVGALAMAWLIAHLTLRAWRTAPGRFGYAATTAYAVPAFTIAGSSYGLWQSWWIAALVLGAVLAHLSARAASGATPAPASRYPFPRGGPLA